MDRIERNLREREVAALERLAAAMALIAQTMSGAAR